MSHNVCISIYSLFCSSILEPSIILDHFVFLLSNICSSIRLLFLFFLFNLTFPPPQVYPSYFSPSLMPVSIFIISLCPSIPLVLTFFPNALYSLPSSLSPKSPHPPLLFLASFLLPSSFFSSFLP